MNRLVVALTFSAFLVGAPFAIADEGEKHHEAKSVSVQGEIVDMGCYLGHGATGQDHKSCALKCIAGGMPMGLLTSDGALYLLTMSHDDADPFRAAKELAAEIVEITGAAHDRNGIKSIEVAHVKLADLGEAESYTCPMHPEIVQEGAGSCPKCGMDLELSAGAATKDK